MQLLPCFGSRRIFRFREIPDESLSLHSKSFVKMSANTNVVGEPASSSPLFSLQPTISSIMICRSFGADPVFCRLSHNNLASVTRIVIANQYLIGVLRTRLFPTYNCRSQYNWRSKVPDSATNVLPITVRITVPANSTMVHTVGTLSTPQVVTVVMSPPASALSQFRKKEKQMRSPLPALLGPLAETRQWCQTLPL